MKFINQRDYPHYPYVTRIDLEGEELEYGKTTTVSNSGCGLCCAVMLVDRLLPDFKFELNDAIRLSYECGSNHLRGTDYRIFADVFAKKAGLELEKSKDPARLEYCLATGGAAIINVKGDRDGRVGVFSHEGHFILAINKERDGRIAILDPNYKEGIYEEEGRRGLVEIKNGCIALCDIQVLIDDTEPAETGYYLFWRK